MKFKLRLKKEVKLEQLHEFDFKPHHDTVQFKREVNGSLIYLVTITSRNRNVQIQTNGATIGSSLQLLIYRLTMAGLVEEVEVE